jgi:hypothetical protein
MRPVPLGGGRDTRSLWPPSEEAEKSLYGFLLCMDLLLQLLNLLLEQSLCLWVCLFLWGLKVNRAGCLLLPLLWICRQGLACSLAWSWLGVILGWGEVQTHEVVYQPRARSQDVEAFVVLRVDCKSDQGRQSGK